MPTVPSTVSPGQVITAAHMNNVRTAIVEMQAGKVDITGDTMSGALFLPSTQNTTGTAAIHKNYADNHFLMVDGTTAMLADLNMNNNGITGLAAPSGPNTATRKAYVDDQVATRVAIAGDTMTGPLLLASPQSTNPAAAIRHNYADGRYLMVETGGTIVGNVIIEGPGGGVPLTLRMAGPKLDFENVGGAAMGYVQAITAGMNYNASDPGDKHHFLVDETEVASLSTSGIAAKSGTFVREDGGNNVVVADYDTGSAGDSAHALVVFHPNASTETSLGTRAAYVGYDGDGMQLQAANRLVVKSNTAEVSIESAGYTEMAADGILIGKSAADADDVGTEIHTSAHPTAVVRGLIRNTVGTAGCPNLYLRHMSGSDASGQTYIDFTASASGTRTGIITQGSGDFTVFNAMAGGSHIATSDHRLKDDLGPIDDPVAKVMQLKPKRLRWRPESGTEGEFDGFIAHEVTPVVPNAVVGEKDAVLPPDDPHDPGGIDPQGIDEKKMVALLTAALQHALTTIVDLTARVTALEAA